MSSTAAHQNKRQRFSDQLKVQGGRKLLLALESGIPEELAWALNGLLLASCDGSAAAVARML